LSASRAFIFPRTRPYRSATILAADRNLCTTKSDYFLRPYGSLSPRGGQARYPYPGVLSGIPPTVTAPAFPIPAAALITIPGCTIPVRGVMAAGILQFRI
jgi:hypothetical protein